MLERDIRPASTRVGSLYDACYERLHDGVLVTRAQCAQLRMEFSADHEDGKVIKAVGIFKQQRRTDRLEPESLLRIWYETIGSWHLHFLCCGHVNI